MPAIGNIIAMRAFNFGGSQTWSEVAANTSAEETVSAPGVLVGDIILVNKPTAQAGLGIAGVRVSADNTIAVTFMNSTAAGITPTASELYEAVLLRPELPLNTNASI